MCLITYWFSNTESSKSGLNIPTWIILIISFQKIQIHRKIYQLLKLYPGSIATGFRALVFCYPHNLWRSWTQVSHWEHKWDFPADHVLFQFLFFPCSWEMVFMQSGSHRGPHSWKMTPRNDSSGVLYCLFYT